MTISVAATAGSFDVALACRALLPIEVADLELAVPGPLSAATR